MGNARYIEQNKKYKIEHKRLILLGIKSETEDFFYSRLFLNLLSTSLILFIVSKLLFY